MWHVTWTANACYTSDLCVSSHDLCDMRAQCTTFWTPPLEVEFQLKLQFPSRVLCSVVAPWALYGVAQIPISVHHTIFLISMALCLSRFASSGVII